MLSHDDVLRCIFRAVDEVNQQLPPEQRLSGSPDVRLLGDGGLDSLAFLNLVVTTEEKLREDHGVDVNLAATLMEQPDADPPATVEALVLAVRAILEKQASA